MFALILKAALLFVVILLLGMLYTRFVKAERNDLKSNYIAGFVILISIFHGLFLPMIFFRLSFGLACTIFLFFIAAMCVVSVLINTERWREFFMYIKEVSFVKKSENKNEINYESMILFTAVIIVTIVQMVLYQVLVFHVSRMDAFYVGTAMTTIESNQLYSINPYTGFEYSVFPIREAMSPLPIFFALLSEFFGTHPTILIRNVFPIYIFLFIYFLYYSIGKLLFEGNKKKALLFLFFWQFIHFYLGVFGEFAPNVNVLLLLHTGEYLLMAGFIPAMFYVYMKLFWKEECKANWIMMGCIVFASTMVSTMGAILGTISIGILGVAYFITEKKIRQTFYVGLCCIPNIIQAIILLMNYEGVDLAILIYGG